MGQNRTFLRAATVAAHLCGMCAMASAGDIATAKDIRVVTTIFPVWDWVREVAGENAAGVENTLLLDDGVDLHSYQPTAADLRKMAECDLFIHVGGESDAWVGPALAASPNPRRRVLNLVEALGDAAKAEVLVEGMEHDGHHHHDDGDHHGDGDEDHHDDGDHHDDEDDEGEIDEHVWLSLRTAQRLVGEIAGELARLDPGNAAIYRANAEAYIAKLAALDGEYAAAVAAAPRRAIIVADRFPLRYLADDYGLEYFAAFSGCSAETEASFRTVIFLAAKADEIGAKSLLVLEGPGHKIAETVRNSTKWKNQAIAVFDSLQSTTARQASEGKTYLATMRANLSALSEALR